VLVCPPWGSLAHTLACQLRLRKEGPAGQGGGSSQPRVDIVPTTMTTGSGLTLKQPCRPCPSPFHLIHLPPLDRPPCSPTTPNPSQQHRTIRNQPRTTHREDFGRVVFRPCNPVPRPPFQRCCSCPSMPPWALQPKCTRPSNSVHSDADERARNHFARPAPSPSPVPIPRVGQAKQPCKRI
jgi:hypothetical protein